MAKTITVQYDDNDPEYDLIKAGADARDTTPSKMLQEGQNLKGIAHDQAWQALNRLIQRGVYPAEIVAEAQAEADRQVAARKGAAK